jgi:hypothetical protein
LPKSATLLPMSTNIRAASLGQPLKRSYGSRAFRGVHQCP